MFRHRHIQKNAARTAIAALAASLFFSLGTVHADNRFGDGVGGAMGGTGSFGEGSVTIHHNLLPEERQEIDNDIADLRNELMAKLTQLEAQLSNRVQSKQLVCSRNGKYYGVGQSYQTTSGSGRIYTYTYTCSLSGNINNLSASWVQTGRSISD